MSAGSERAYRVAIDVGGTFTDVVIGDQHGRLTVGKGLSDREQPYRGFEVGLNDAAGTLGVDPSELLARTNLITYGTTRATNAIVEGKVAKTAALLTEGFRDILVLRQGGKRNPFEIFREFPAPYIPRNLTYEVPERVNSEGGVEKPLDEDAVREIIDRLAKRDVEAVAVSLLWSVANGQHERRIGELLAEFLPGVPYTLSHELNPVVREYPRTSSTAIDVSLKPLMQEHLRSFRDDLGAAGFGGELLVSTSSGGVMHLDEVIERPIHMCKSGPAMAPLAGIAYAEDDELGDDVIVVDAGGTTFDVSVIRDGQIKYTRETWLVEEFVGHNLGVPTVDVRSIGAGGGSIAWIDEGGLLHVGPQSAGADPGPACYGQGGDKPTVTDAAVALGYIDPKAFLGGRMELDLGAARRVVGEVATALEIATEAAASAILTLSSEEMIKAIEAITVKDGVNPAESLLLAGGGAAGLNIVPIARALGCTRVLIPRTAGALSACGAQYSDIVAEFGGSCYAHSDDFDFEGVNAVLSDIDGRMDSFAERLAERGVEAFSRDYFTESRYLNQQWEMEIPVSGSRVSGADDVAALKSAFDAQHERLYEVKEPDGPIECINWNGRITASLARPRQQCAELNGSLLSSPDRTTTAYFGRPRETPVFLGDSLEAGMAIDGPAIIEEPTTTIVVDERSRCTVTATGNYLLDVEPEEEQETTGGGAIDPVQLAIMANRLDAILREVTETILLTARSTVIGIARDFSCGISTSEDEVVALEAGLPMHIFGTHIQAASIKREHPDFAEGDAFLHNDPYDGNSHPGDHVTLVPVFHEGEHFFTVTVKCHVADTGNSIPTTYHAGARDVYEEGTLIFPCVRVQHDYEDVEDIVRMCRRRIRVPDQWYGDFMAAIGAARVGERGLKAFIAKYGRETVREFVEEWLDYTSRRVAAEIAKLPAGRVHAKGKHDPLPPMLPDGIPLQTTIDVDPAGGMITVDLTENPDNLPCGLNLTESTSTMGSMQAIFCCIDPSIQHNAGSFRHIDVKLREGAVVGIPRFPYSCSVATTNVSDVMINITQEALSQLGDGQGGSHTGLCLSGGAGVVSGKDHRKADAAYVTQLFLMNGGGPANAFYDGMTYALVPPAIGLIYRDSVEIDEQRMPFIVRFVRLVQDSAGAGRRRGGPAGDVLVEARESDVTIVSASNGTVNPPRGVVGGHAANCASNTVIRAGGDEQVQASFFVAELAPGDALRSIDCGGGGYGDPRERELERVLQDVREGYVSEQAARDVYGVAVTGSADDETLAVDEAATRELRS